MSGKAVAVVRIDIEEGDKGGPRSDALHLQTAIRRTQSARRHGVPGCGRVWQQGEVHADDLLHLSVHLPLVLEFFDEPEVVETVLPRILDMAPPGHVVYWTAQCGCNRDRPFPPHGSTPRRPGFFLFSTRGNTGAVQTRRRCARHCLACRCNRGVSFGSRRRRKRSGCMPRTSPCCIRMICSMRSASVAPHYPAGSASVMPQSCRDQDRLCNVTFQFSRAHSAASCRRLYSVSGLAFSQDSGATMWSSGRNPGRVNPVGS